VKTKRAPALTSPWKIGFLVSLLLILMSIAVNYLIFRKFNLSWSSIGFKEGSWFFHREEFVQELLPLVALIAAASMVAYFTITSAVRRYRAYLDSGHDYRRLISAIEKCDDLDSENFGRRLGKYPELRKFLTSVRDQVRRREKELSEREKEINKRPVDGGIEETFEKECRTLAEAVPDLLCGEVQEDLRITSPGLLGIEETLRSVSADRRDRMEGNIQEQIANAAEEIRQASSDIRNRLTESSRELDASCSTARELEGQLSEVAASLEQEEAGAADDGGVRMLQESIKTLQELNKELSEVGEESKSIAINTALRAGAGESTLEDVIRLAEEVRNVALKFLDLSRSFGETTERMRADLGRFESEQGRLRQLSTTDSRLAPSIGALKNKMSLWVERVVILNDHFKNAEDLIDLSLLPIDRKLSAFAGDVRRDEEEVAPDTEGIRDRIEEEAGDDEIAANEFTLETVDAGAYGSKKAFTLQTEDSETESHDILGIEKNREHIFSQPEAKSEIDDSRLEDRSRVEPPADSDDADQEGDENQEDDEVGFEELPPGEKTGSRPEPAEASFRDGVMEIEPSEEDARYAVDEDLGLETSAQQHEFGTTAQRESDYAADKLEGQVAFDLTRDAEQSEEDAGSSIRLMNETSVDSGDEVVDGEEFPSAMVESDNETNESDADDDEKVIDLYTLGAVDIG